MINLYDMCEEKAKQGLDTFKKFLNNTKDLLYTVIEQDGIGEVEVEYFADEDCILTEFLGSWEFDDEDKFIEE